MSCIRLQPVTGPLAWRGADLAGDERWIHHLSGAEVSELDAALATLKAAGRRFPDFGREHFPLPLLAPRLAGIAEELEHGRGFLVLRGLPVQRLRADAIDPLTFGTGLPTGQPCLL